MAGCDEWKRKNARKAKEIKLKRYYGITANQYYAMSTSQGDVCKICKGKCKTGRELSVDHCHTIGKIRGLLCSNCNSGLGSFKDNVELMAEGIKYLENSNGN